MAYTVPEGSVVHNLDANMDMHAFPPIADLTQYDTTVPILAVKLWAGGKVYKIPATAQASIRMKKPDGKNVYNPAIAISDDRQTVYIAVTPQMTAASGEGKAIIELAEGGKVIGSGRLTLNIAANPVRKADIESGDEYLTLQELVAQAQAAASAAKNSENAAKQSETKAENSATQAENWTNKSKSWAIGEGDSTRSDQQTNNSKYWSEQSALHEAGAKNAQGAAESAQHSAESARDEASNSKTAAADSASAALASQGEAAKSAASALESEKKAAESSKTAGEHEAASKEAQQFAELARDAAKQSETKAANSATQSENWTNKSKSWAIGEGDPSRANQTTDNSKYYSQQSSKSASAAAGSATNAADSAGDAQTAQSAAETARDKAASSASSAAKDRAAIENMTVDVETGEAGTDAKVEKSVDGDNVHLHFTIPKGVPGVVTTLNGVFMFQVDEAGDLWMIYDDMADPPEFYYDDGTGELYFVFEEVSA